MSLQVWLPLNGNFNNQGIGKVTITGGTPTFKTAEKIGEQGIDLKTQVKFSCPALANLSTFTVAFWAKAESSSTLKDTWVDLFGFSSKNTSGSSGTFRWETCYSGSSLGIHWHNNTVNAFTSSSANHISKKDTWVHCCVVFNKEKGKLYSYNNGSLFYNVNHLGGTINASGEFYFGQTNKIEGVINDLRIYDHALSPQEVKEISKGLVLHYKLDGGPTFPPKNLLLNSKKDAGKSHTTYSVAEFNFSEALSSGGNYTIIAKVNTSSEKKSVGFYHSGSSIQIGGWQSISSNGIYKITFTATSNMASQTSGSGYGFCRVYTSNNSGKAQDSTALSGTANVEWITLYNGSGEGIYVPAEGYDGICYDSSGYNHNGTIIGKYATAPSESNGGKYKCSCFVNSNLGGYIAIKNQLYSIRDEMTVSLWVNKTWPSNTGTPFSSIEEGGFGWQRNGANYTFQCGTGVSSNTYISEVLTVNNLTSGWHMLSATYDGLALRLYIDGVLKSTTPKYTTKTPLYYNNNSGMFIGRESDGNINTSTTAQFQGSINDVRIYATALSDEEIQKLYNTSGVIDNNGNLYTRELVE